jgi:hypothetical protein
MIPAAADAQNATIDRIEAIVERLYNGLQPGLLRAAGRSAALSRATARRDWTRIIA